LNTRTVGGGSGHPAARLAGRRRERGAPVPGSPWRERHHSEPLLVADLAELAGMSPSAFHRHFRAATSMTPIQFQKQIRMKEARVLLRTRSVPVADIGHLVGYGSPSQFSREYLKAFGVSPGEDRASQPGRTPVGGGGGRAHRQARR
jgi:AraC-like DNA-binding protein